MKIELKLRTDEAAPLGNKSHYEAVREDGKKFSVLDIGSMMEDFPHKYDGMFLGWEALEINKDGKLEGWLPIRTNTWEELEVRLMTYEGAEG